MDPDPTATARMLHRVLVGLWLALGVILSVRLAVAERGYWDLRSLGIGLIWVIIVPIVIVTTLVARWKPSVGWVLAAHVLLPTVGVPLVATVLDVLDWPM